jgi:pimeloyl-ACP methyl ester carboxylesterase
MTEHRMTHRPAGESIHATVDGHGPAILFLAGTGHDTSDWHRAGYVARLCRSYQVIAVDLPGQGRTRGSTDAADYYLPPMLAILETVANDLGLSEFALLGYSFGGVLALQAAAHLPRVRAVIAMGTTSARPVDAEMAVRAASQARRVHQAKSRGSLESLSLTPAQFRTAVRMDIPAHIAALHGQATWPLLDLRQLRCPGLLYLSPDDAAAAADLLASLGDAPGSPPMGKLRAHVEAGLDHESVFEQSQRALNRIEPFLAENSW